MDGRAAAARGLGREEEELTERVGVFGGTFDPVHVGHLAIALAALESVPLDRILFVPVRRSPLKDRDPLASVVDRVTMLEAAIASEPRFVLSQAELHRARAFDAPQLDISSRELRARAARGMSLRYLVPDAVWEHIKKRGLYQ